MPVPARRLRLALFAGAVAIPNAVLLAAALRMAAQERELEAQRRGERRIVLATRLGQELRARLERVRVRALGALGQSTSAPPTDSALVFVARLRGERLLVPWEQGAAERPARRPEYDRLMASAEAAEFRQQRPDAAAALYAQAAAISGDTAARAEATLREARVLARSGRTASALARYRDVAVLPASIRDRDGMPLALYAAEPLLAAGGGHADTGRQTLRRLLGDLSSLGPPAIHALRDLGQRGGVLQDDRLTRHLALIDQTRSLERSLPGLLMVNADTATGAVAPAAWMAFGPEPWLVSVERPRESEDAPVVVVRPSVLLAQLSGERGPLSRAAATVRLTTASDAGAETLDRSLTRVRAVFTDQSVLESSDSPLGTRIFLVVLPLVAMLTLLVAWLFWRDVRREVAAAELRSQFVSGVSHELKTPLTSIRMFAETLLLGRPAHEEGRREYLETIVQESERLTRLINNVLDFSRIERGEQHYRFEPTDLGSVVRDSARAMAYPLRQNGFELSLTIPDALPPVAADRDALVQALLNLLSNAMKYSGDQRTIELSLARENGDALIRVRDCGIGIAPKDRQRIFERYYRTPETESSNIPGTGLGLPLVAHIAQAHGGGVEVDSAPGRGSTFTLRLPLERTA